jgi:transketolase
MRKTFSKLTYNVMQHNSEIHLLTGDLGYIMWDDVRKDFNNRFHNVGCAEQLLLGASIGLALEGKLPIVYSITPFLLYRPFELIRNYIFNENIKVKLVGSGRNRDYLEDKFTHWAEEDKDVLALFPNIKIFYPEDINELKDCFEEYMFCDQPSYINLKR